MQVQTGGFGQGDRTPEAKGILAKASSSGKKPARRKGGLSMFLAGKASSTCSVETAALSMHS